MIDQISYLSNLLLTILITGGIVFTSHQALLKKAFPQWLGRDDYGQLSQRQWVKMCYFGAGASLLTTILSFYLVAEHYSTHSPIILGVIVGVMTWFLAVAAQTDQMFRLVPKEITNLFLIVSFIIFGLSVGAGGQRMLDVPMFSDPLGITFMNFGIYQGFICFVFLFWLFISTKISGFADIKVFWAMGFMMSWVVGVGVMIVIGLLSYIFLAVVWLCHWVESLVKKNPELRKKALPMLPSYFVATVIAVLMGFSRVSLVDVFTVSMFWA